jgi:hypothetical protein
LATTNDEVDLAVRLLECTIGVDPFGWWRRCPLLAVVVLAVVVVLETSIVTTVVVTVIVAIITSITSIALISVVVTTVVIASVIAAVIAAIITSIPIVIARIGSTVTVISSIRSTIAILEALTTVAVVIAVAPGLLGGGWYPKGTLELLAFPHVCLASRWNWHWSSMTILKSPSRKVEGLGGSVT